MKPLEQVQLLVMEALAEKPMTLFDLMLVIEEGTTIGVVGLALQALVDANYVQPVFTSTSSAGVSYGHARRYAMSDLRQKLLPSRDPVREAHEHAATQGMRGRYRRTSEHGADLDLESG